MSLVLITTLFGYNMDDFLEVPPRTGWRTEYVVADTEFVVREDTVAAFTLIFDVIADVTNMVE